MSAQRQRIWRCAVCIALTFAGLTVVLAAAHPPAILTRITHESFFDRDSFSPQLNADGTKIAFESESDFFSQNIPINQFEIWLYDLSALKLTRITTASMPGRVSLNPTISANGMRIAFESGSDFRQQGIVTGQMEIWLYDASTPLTHTRITTASAPGRTGHNPAISADGTKIAFESDSLLRGTGVVSGQFEIWLYDTAALAYTRITTASTHGRLSGEPSISGDGKLIAFRSESDILEPFIPQHPYEIWLYDTVALTYTRVTTVSNVDRNSRHPVISADGSVVVFESDSDFKGEGIPANHYELWMYNVAERNLTRITYASADDGRRSRNPSLSADGRRVAFDSDSDFLGEGLQLGQSEIWLYDTQTMTSTRITWANPPKTSRDSVEPSLSGNGRAIAFYSDSDFWFEVIPDEQYEIWFARVPAGAIYMPLVLKN